jgi:molecular chaperone GrpE
MIIPIKADEPKKDHYADESVNSEAAEQVVDVGPTEPEPEPAAQTKDADYLDQLLRLKAEFDNYRKRVEREKDDFYAYARGRVIQNLLPILDDLDRMVHFNKGRGNAGENGDSAFVALVKGLDLIHQKTKTLLLGEGLEEINPAGKPFDPAFHEAIGIVETDPQQDGVVMEELERGYLLQGKLLRPSRVRVGKAREQ